MMTRVLPFALLAFSVACADDRPGTKAGFAVDTVAGVEIRRNSGIPAEWHAEQLVRIGAADQGPAAFGRVRSVLADSEGTVFVADNFANEVRVFDPRGTFLRSFGRKGGGPGEFGDLYSLAWLGPELVVMDPGNARLGRFSKDGTWIDGMRHFPLTGPGTLIRLHPVGNSGYYAPVIDPSRGDLPFVRMTADGPADTIGAPQPPEAAPQYWVRCDRPDGGVQGISVPDAPTTVFGFPPAGALVAVSWTADYRIAFRTAAKDTVHVVERSQAPLTYSDSLWNEVTRPLREIREEYPGTRCDPPQPDRPSTRSALRSIVFDGSGAMWVEAAAADGFVWDVYDREGRLQGRAPAPARDETVPVYVRGDRLYQVERDELGVQYVVVYRVGPRAS